MIGSDLKYAIRSLLKNSSMTLTALTALALGIGANIALFAVVNAVLLRPLAYPHAERIVELARSFQGKVYGAAVTPLKYDFWSRESHSFEAVGAYSFGPLGVNLTRNKEAERLISLPVTAGFFQVLGMHPIAGRTFTAPEDRPGAGHFAVISYPLWQRLFNGDPNIAGRQMVLNAADYTVVGVMPREFEFPIPADLWTPLQLKIDPSDNANDYDVIARLKPDIPLVQAAQDMHLVAQRFRKQFGGGIMMGDYEDIGVVDFHSWITGDVRPALLVLMGAVGFVLLIACANVANLLLARSAIRQHEMAVRTALGATVGQLVRLVFTESLLLAVAGTGVAVLLADLSVPVLLGLAPADLALKAHVNLQGAVVLFAAAIAIAAGLVFGSFPAWQIWRFGIGNPLREAGTRTATSGSGNRTRHLLVIAEVGISLVLLVGAGLMMRTFHNLSHVRPGFDARNVLTTQMSVSDDRFRSTAATAAMVHRIAKRLESIPGVEAVGTINSLPTEPGFDNPFEIIGRSSSGAQDELQRIVSPRYFSALRIPVLSGRYFTEYDSQESRRVIIINQALALKYFPHENPIGQQILVGRMMGPIFADQPREIVGVVGDTSDAGLTMAAQPIYFEPLAQMPDKLLALDNQLQPLNWVIRTSGDPHRLAEQLRKETLTASGGVPMAEPRLLDQVIGNSIARQRFTMTLLTTFAGLAMLLGAIGLYGVISYSVAQRTREFGIRAALGAAQRDLSRLVVRQGMWLAGIGISLGLVGALALTRFLQGMLYGITAFDPLVLLTTSGTLALIALAACWFPAMRASRVDPVITLREQ